MNPMDLKRGIERAVEAVVAELKTLAQPCATSQDIAHVAAISANNDRSIGDLIARAMDKVGREGAVTIEDGSGRHSELEVVEGLRPRLAVAVLHQQRRTAGRGAGERLHPAHRPEARLRH